MPVRGHNIPLGKDDYTECISQELLSPQQGDGLILLRGDKHSFAFQC